MDTVSQDQPLKYKDLINQSSADIAQEELDLKVQTTKSDLEVIAATNRRDLAAAKRKVIEAQRAYPYSIQAELDAIKEVDSLQKGLDFVEKVLTERF